MSGGRGWKRSTPWEAGGQVHGILMTLAWGVLLPVGAVVARNFKTASALWFHIHRATQVPPPAKVAPIILLKCLAYILSLSICKTTRPVQMLVASPGLALLSCLASTGTAACASIASFFWA